MEIRSLTGMRGIAAWMVVFYHLKDVMAGEVGFALTRWFGGGYLAVDLFFVLSGFVICINYTALPDYLTVRGFCRFVGKRLARIYPLHLIVLLLYLLNPVAILLFSQAKLLDERYDFAYYLQSLLLIQNWGFNDGLAWNVPAWSISVELLAYMFFPILLAFSRGVVSLFGIVGGIFLFLGLVFSIPLVWLGVGASSMGEYIGSMGWFRCVSQFAIGVLIGVFYLDGMIATDRSRVVFVVLILLILVLALFLQLADMFWMPLASVALVQYLSVSTGFLARFLSSRLIYLLGMISYSTYLAHYWIRDWFMFLDLTSGWVHLFFYCAVLMVFSICLYKFVEEPGRRLFLRIWGRII